MAAPKKTKNRPTRDEERERAEYAYELTSRLLYHGQIKAAIIKRFNVHWRTAESYIARARARILEESGRSKDEHKADSLAFYMTIVRSPDAEDRVRILARERYDRILGLDTPQKVAFTDPTGKESVPLTLLQLVQQAAPALGHGEDENDHGGVTGAGPADGAETSARA